jgi:hypothetical protein
MKNLAWLFVALILTVLVPTIAQADFQYGHGPIMCNIPMDSMDTKCKEAVMQHGNTGHCTVDGTRAGKDYTIDIHVSGHSVPFRNLPPIKQASAAQGKFTCWVVSSEKVTGTCSSSSSASGGAGHCIYCVNNACHEASGSARATEKKPGRKTFANQ